MPTSGCCPLAVAGLPQCECPSQGIPTQIRTLTLQEGDPALEAANTVLTCKP